MKKIEYHYVTKDIKEFVLGGKSEFTILNTLNDVNYKYRIKANKEHDIWFVSIKLDGSFKYAGFIKKEGITGSYQYIRGKKGTVDARHEAVKGLFWVIRNADNMNPIVKVIHHGKCACCGKALTDERSIERGIGPICYAKVKQYDL